MVYGLSRATIQEGHQVEVWLPKYDQIKNDQLKKLQKKQNGIWSAEFDGLHLKLFQAEKYFNRGTIYGCIDDIERFSHFAHLVITFLQKLPRPPDVIHLHDWPTALVAPLMRLPKFLDKFRNTKLIFTIHNLEHQGRCLPHQIAVTGLPPTGMEDPRLKTDINLLIGGVTFSDWVTTVSPTYLNEILTPLGGHGLDAFLNKNRTKLRGILNGIDIDYWNPETDPHLAHPYSVHSLQSKRENKRALRSKLGLKEDETPLVASITRLVPQKGPHLIELGLSYTLKHGGQFVLIGSSPMKEIQAQFDKLKAKVQGERAAFHFNYNEPLAHLVYAAADLLLIPSIFEPCGLTQMIALRYGAVPVVRATGGLKDTVFDWETSKQSLGLRNGFTFDFPDNAGIEWGLGRALRTYREKPEEWQEIMRHGMTQDFSWKQSAKEYLELYLT